MKITHYGLNVKTRLLTITLFLLCLSVPVDSPAQYRVELTPSISLQEEYNDNLFLDNTDRQSDYITTVSPGVGLKFSSEQTNLGFRYSPTFVYYAKTDLDTEVRHSAALDFTQDLSDRLQFQVIDTFLRSEQPIEPIESFVGETSVRRDRQPYWRNRGETALHYSFGPEDKVSMGYRQEDLRNRADDVDDGRIRTPFLRLTYWFDLRNGMELDYAYTKASFWREDASVAGDDYTGHASGGRYIRRFSPHTSGSLGYTYTTRRFDGVTEDYDVHNGSVGLDHRFSPDLSLSATVGYFVHQREGSEDTDGPSYNLSLVKRFDRGRFTLGGSGGWREEYLEAEARGFVRYWGIDSSVEYQISERLKGYVNGSYVLSKDDEENRDWKTWRAGGGLSWPLLRWLSVSLDYTRTQRIDDLEEDEFTENRVMLTLTAATLYRW
jgi:hypothetical protein